VTFENSPSNVAAADQLFLLGGRDQRGVRGPCYAIDDEARAWQRLERQPVAILDLFSIMAPGYPALGPDTMIE
jgi:hypothetical protein